VVIPPPNFFQSQMLKNTTPTNIAPRTISPTSRFQVLPRSAFEVPGAIVVITVVVVVWIMMVEPEGLLLKMQDPPEILNSGWGVP
jgi:hypothetical protein